MFKPAYPKKKFGQHFLINSELAKTITQCLNPLNSNILEIGPGRGILTQFLMVIPENNCCFVEIDNDCVSHLNTKFPEIHKQIIQKDILKLNFEELFNSDHFSVIGNFPYNISSQIIFKILDYHEKIDQVVGMFQKEVAERIVSQHNSKKYGILSILVQLFYDTEYIMNVDENEFHPPPKITSAVIKLTKKKNAFPQKEYKKIKQLVKLAFNQRRKMLRNSLSSLKIEIPEKYNHLRPEQIDINEFINLYNILKTNL